MLTAKLGNKLFDLNETTKNFKQLHAFFVNRNLRKDVEYSNCRLHTDDANMEKE